MTQEQGAASAPETLDEKRARFEALALPAVDALYRQAMRYTNNPEDAQDLVQDTFERGFKAFDTFREGSNFDAWMATIERNAFFNHYAKMKRRPQRANGSTGEYDDWDIYEASEHQPQGLKSAEQEFLEGYAPAEIIAALDSLSPERRQIFIDAAIDGKSYRQIAQEQGVPIGTVMSRLNRARTQLRAELEEFGAERGYGKGGHMKADGRGKRPKKAVRSAKGAQGATASAPRPRAAAASTADAHAHDEILAGSEA